MMRRLTERLAEFAGTLDGIAFINPPCPDELGRLDDMFLRAAGIILTRKFE